MTMQPQNQGQPPAPAPAAQSPAPVQPQPAPPQVAPGWYPDPSTPGMQRYHNGTAWTGHVAPLAMAPPQPQPRPVMVVAGGPSHLSGMSTGGHLVHGTLTVLTLGMWAPIWWLTWRMGRRAIR